MAEMSKKEIRDFLMQGTLTGKLATVKPDGSREVSFNIIKEWLDKCNQTFRFLSYLVYKYNLNLLFF